MLNKILEIKSRYKKYLKSGLYVEYSTINIEKFIGLYINCYYCCEFNFKYRNWINGIDYEKY